MNEDLQYLFDSLGFDNFLKLCKHFEGRSVYFKKVIVKDMLKEKIIFEYSKGENYKNLARKYGYTESWIRCICNGN